MSVVRPLSAEVSVSLLHFVQSRHSVLWQLKARLVFLLQSTSVCHFLGSHVEIIFSKNKMTWKRTDGDSAKAVREQVFLSRCKSEHGVVESSVSKSFAYCQYRQLDLSVAHGSKNGINKKHCPWSVAKN